MLDTWVKKGAELSTDHHLVVSWIRQAKRIEKVGWKCLAEDPVKSVFNYHL